MRNNFYSSIQWGIHCTCVIWTVTTRECQFFGCQHQQVQCIKIVSFLVCPISRICFSRLCRQFRCKYCFWSLHNWYASDCNFFVPLLGQVLVEQVARVSFPLLFRRLKMTQILKTFHSFGWLYDILFFHCQTNTI